MHFANHLGFRFPPTLEFSKKLLTDAKVAHVRFSLIENEERTRQALRGIKQMLQQ